MQTAATIIVVGFLSVSAVAHAQSVPPANFAPAYIDSALTPIKQASALSLSQALAQLRTTLDATAKQMGQERDQTRSSNMAETLTRNLDTLKKMQAQARITQMLVPTLATPNAPPPQGALTTLQQAQLAAMVTPQHQTLLMALTQTQDQLLAALRKIGSSGGAQDYVMMQVGQADQAMRKALQEVGPAWQALAAQQAAADQMRAQLPKTQQTPMTLAPLSAEQQAAEQMKQLQAAQQQLPKQQAAEQSARQLMGQPTSQQKVLEYRQMLRTDWQTKSKQVEATQQQILFLQEQIRQLQAMQQFQKLLASLQTQPAGLQQVLQAIVTRNSDILRAPPGANGRSR